MIRSIAEETHIVSGIEPKANDVELTGDYLNLSNCAHVAVVCHIVQGFATPVALTLEQAKDVSGTDSKPLTEVVPVRVVEDAVASDLHSDPGDAVEFTTDAALGTKIVIFEIDPATLDVNNGFGCLCVKAGASNAANLVSAMYVAAGLRSRDVSMVVDV